MRIIHTCLRYPPATGGVETHIEQLVKGTRNIHEQRDVRVLTSNMRTHHPITRLNPDLLLDDPPYVQRLHHAATPLVAYPRLQALSYYIGHHKPDLLHGHSFWYQPADTAARYARKHRIPFIFHPYFYESIVRKKFMWQAYKQIQGRRTFAAADVVVVISPHEQALIQKAGMPARRFELIPPGINTAEFEQQKANPFATRHITGQIILAVSRLAEGKGLDELIQAFVEVRRSTPDTQLVIVGDDFGVREKLEKMTEHLGATGHVHFLGKLTRDELIGAYQHATVFAHPSHYEAFGIVLAESLAAGTPVVARNTAAIPFVAPHKKAGLLFDTQDQFVELLSQLLKNKSRRNQLAAAGRGHVQHHFTQDRTIKKLVDLYAEFSQPRKP